MRPESQIPIASTLASWRFARRLALFYAAMFGLLGGQLPFFPTWLRAIGIDASWIGIITAVPALTRFTILPMITGLAERRAALRGAIMLSAFLTTLGFLVVGTQHLPLLVLLVYAATAVVWTPMVPLTDAYALRGVVRYGINYGPVRLWGSAAFVVGALVCGSLADIIPQAHLIWIIAALAALGALVGLGLQPLESDRAPPAVPQRPTLLLREPSFLAIIVASALVQGSHVAFYTFSAISWKQAGLSGLTIAALWALGVMAEIVVFALSPRFTLQPATLVMIGAMGAIMRWLITAQEPPLAVLAVVQLAHGLSFGITQIGTMGLMVQHVPIHAMARGQGYLTACGGIVASGASILSGAIYARYGEGVYLVMAAMALSGFVVMWSARRHLVWRL